MQRYKRSRLDAAGVHDDRVFAPVNFEVDRLDASLDRAGFSRETPTFWIWEGVTMYLTLEAMRATLRSVAALSAPGSRIALTYSPFMHDDAVASAVLPIALRALQEHPDRFRCAIARHTAGRPMKLCAP